MRFMIHDLQPFIRIFLVVYFDDILGYIKCWFDQVNHLRQLFGTLREVMLFANLKKCAFPLTSGALFEVHCVCPRYLS